MNRLDAFVDPRHRVAARYAEALAALPLSLPPAELDGRSALHLYVVLVAGNRDAILAALHEKGIGAGIHYPIPCHLQPALAELGYKEGDFPIAESVANQIISLPMFPELSHEQMDTIAATLREIMAPTWTSMSPLARGFIRWKSCCRSSSSSL